jgi:chaperonin cofactor prefoldin
MSAESTDPEDAYRSRIEELEEIEEELELLAEEDLPVSERCGHLLTRLKEVRNG